MTNSEIPQQFTAILSGVRTLICRPEESAQALSSAMSSLGADCYIFPTLDIIQTNISDEDRQCILNLDQYQKVIVTSQHAAKLGLELIDTYWPQLPIGQTWLAIGQKTASLLAEASIKLDIPKQDFTSESLLKIAQLQKVKHEKILIIKGEEGRDTLTQVLSKRGAKVEAIQVYRRSRPAYTSDQITEALLNFNASYIVALSGETLLNLISLCEEHNIDLSSKTFVVPSHRVANIAYEHGFKSVLIPANLKPIDLIKCITKHKNSTLKAI